MLINASIQHFAVSHEYPYRKQRWFNLRSFREKKQLFVLVLIATFHRFYDYLIVIERDVGKSQSERSKKITYKYG